MNAREYFLEQYRALSASGDAFWPCQMRDGAATHLEELGFPTPKNEEWKYSNVDRVLTPRYHASPSKLSHDFSEIVTKDALRPFLLEGAKHIVFVDGVFVPSLSTKDISIEKPSRISGAKMSSLTRAAIHEKQLLGNHLGKYAQIAKQEHAFVALNTAMMRDGFVLHVPAGVTIDNALQLMHVSTGNPKQASVSHLRHLVVLDEGSQARVVEMYVGFGNGRYLTNAVTEIALGRDAQLEFYKVGLESDFGNHVATVQSRLSQDSRLVSLSATLGGAFVRNDISSVLDGQNSECTLDGLYVADGEQHVDNHTTIDHAHPNSRSFEIYKGILDGRAKGVFNGRILVRQAAQKTDAKQSNMSLLLSDHAVVNAKPQLEIFADDVKCTHGATIGQLDDEQLFYLRSRGISEAEARQFLLRAFASELVESVRLKSLRDWLSNQLEVRLPRVVVSAD